MVDEILHLVIAGAERLLASGAVAVLALHHADSERQNRTARGRRRPAGTARRRGTSGVLIPRGRVPIEHVAVEIAGITADAHRRAELPCADQAVVDLVRAVVVQAVVDVGDAVARIPCDPAATVGVDRVLVEAPSVAIHPRPHAGQLVIALHELVDPRNALTVLPVKNRDALALVARCVLAEELRLSRRVVAAREVVEPEADAVADALLHEPVAALVDEPDALGSLDDDRAQPAVLDDGRDVEPRLPVGNINKLHAHSVLILSAALLRLVIFSGLVLRRYEPANISTVHVQAATPDFLGHVALDDRDDAVGYALDDAHVVGVRRVVAVSAVVPVVQDDVGRRRHVAVVFLPDAHVLRNLNHARTRDLQRDVVRVAGRNRHSGDEARTPFVRVLQLISPREGRVAVVRVDDALERAVRLVTTDPRLRLLNH